MNLDANEAAREYRERLVGPYRDVLPEAVVAVVNAVFEAQGTDDPIAQAMQRRGQEALAAVPGALAEFVGVGLRENSRPGAFVQQRSIHIVSRSMCFIFLLTA